MHDSRKTFFNVLIDNIINPLNLMIIVIMVILILNKDYLYIIPLVLSLIASTFQFGVDFKRHIISKKENIRFHVLQNNKESEKSLLKIRVGDNVVLYPEDVVQFVGKVKDGILFVDESSINGTTALVKKEPYRHKALPYCIKAMP